MLIFLNNILQQTKQTQKYINVTNLTSYRYYAVKIADNHGHATYVGLRRIELEVGNSGDPRKGIILNV